MSDWRDDLAKELVLYSQGLGMQRYDPDDVAFVLKVLADRDRKLPSTKRLGFAYAQDQYSERGVTTLLNKVSEYWTMPEPLQSKPAESVHKLECVISAKLQSEDWGTQQVHETLKTFLIQNVDPPFSCDLAMTQKVFGPWYDLRIRYTCELPQVFKLLCSIPWVLDAITKPASEFGKKTLAYTV